MFGWLCDVSSGAQAKAQRKWHCPCYRVLGWLLVEMMESAWGCRGQGERVSGSEENLEVFCLFTHSLSESMTPGTKERRPDVLAALSIGERGQQKGTDHFWPLATSVGIEDWTVREYFRVFSEEGTGSPGELKGRGSQCP